MARVYMDKNTKRTLSTLRDYTVDEVKKKMGWSDVDMVEIGQEEAVEIKNGQLFKRTREKPETPQQREARRNVLRSSVRSALNITDKSLDDLIQLVRIS